MESIRIPLMGRGLHVRAWTTIDLADYERLIIRRWFLHSSGYAVANNFDDAGKNSRLRMQRIVMGLEAGDPASVDHINGDRLDNRRSNLRVVTHAQNHQNRAPRPGKETRGVGFDKTRGKWRAQHTLNYKNHFIGRYDSEEEAEAAAAAWRRIHMPYSHEGAAMPYTREDAA